jgi:hypothetical protein
VVKLTCENREKAATIAIRSDGRERWSGGESRMKSEAKSSLSRSNPPRTFRKIVSSPMILVRESFQLETSRRSSAACAASPRYAPARPRPWSLLSGHETMYNKVHISASLV